MEKFGKMQVHEGLKDYVDEVWRNDEYEVQLQFADKGKGIKGFIWLQFKHITKEAIHDWRDMQEIKNLICGEEREAFEIFPAESRLVDTSNQYHLFVMPDGEKIDCGYTERAIVEGHDKFVKGKGGSKQRPFKITPKDAITKEEAEKVVGELI